MIGFAVVFIILALIHARCAIAENINITFIYIDVAVYIVTAIAIAKYFI